VREFDHLVTKDKFEEGDDWSKFINPKSVYELDYYGEAALKSLKKGQVIQLERVGYFIVDQVGFGAQKTVLNKIPTGKLNERGVGDPAEVTKYQLAHAPGAAPAAAAGGADS